MLEESNYVNAISCVLGKAEVPFTYGVLSPLIYHFEMYLFKMKPQIIRKTSKGLEPHNMWLIERDPSK